MNKNSKLFAVISYITWVGWVVALIARDQDDALVRRHLNQALILNIVATIASAIGRLGGIFRTIYIVVDIAALVLTIMGIVRAAKGSDEPLPYIGEIELIH